MLRIVAATRHSPLAFPTHSLLGPSLHKMGRYHEILAEVRYRNTRGLPDVFNEALDRAKDLDTILFTHDDVGLDDWYLPERLVEALEAFDVVGVAGNRRRLPRQPSWIHAGFQEKDDGKLAPDLWENLSGAIAHRPGPTCQVSYYGPSPRQVRLLDGVLLAAQVCVLRRAGVRFDAQFSFHFYDMDFCRACEKADLKMGTWPIAVTHGSGGAFGTPAWKSAYELYIKKWGD